MGADGASRLGFRLAGALVAVAAFLPFARGLLTGHSLYFRDLSLQFFPGRLFVLEGLRRLEPRFWNPYANEGVPVTLSPFGYLPDLLQLLKPDPQGLSLVLALHVPLAGIAFLALARDLGLRAPAAALGAVAYALCGFTLSALNLYVYVQAVAWAPLATLSLRRAAIVGGGRRIVAAAVCVGIALTTTGVEVVAQALAIAAALSLLPARLERGLRFAASALLGAGLAGVVVLPLSALVSEESARARGFTTDVVLAHSVHPLTFLQVVVSGLYGDPANLTGRWWGTNFFPRGFPYVLSLYLGATLAALALTGLLHGFALRRRLLALTVLAGLACLGKYAGLGAAVEALDLRMLRYPTKAFYTVAFGGCLLAALGADALGRAPGGGRAARTLAWSAGLLGGLLAAAPALPSLAPGLTRWFLAGFAPPEFHWELRLAVARFLLQDAAAGGLLALGAAGIAWLVAHGRLRAGLATGALAGLVLTDLLRAGAGLVPTVTPEFFELSPQMRAQAESLRAGEARVFTCDPLAAPSLSEARAARLLTHEPLTYAVFQETLVPDFNLPFAVRTGLSQDRTGLVPLRLVLTPKESSCGDLVPIVPRLRAAGVSHVVSLEPLGHPLLEERAVLEPRRIAPLTLRVYALRGALPPRAVARNVRRVKSWPEAEMVSSQPGFQEQGGVAVEGEVPETRGASAALSSARVSASALEVVAESDAPSVVVWRDAFAPGWRATVNGSPAPVMRADGRHRAVPIPAGRSAVRIAYGPPRLGAGVALSLLSLGLCVVLWVRNRRPREGARAGELP